MCRAIQRPDLGDILTVRISYPKLKLLNEQAYDKATSRETLKRHANKPSTEILSNCQVIVSGTVAALPFAMFHGVHHQFLEILEILPPLGGRRIGPTPGKLPNQLRTFSPLL